MSIPEGWVLIKQERIDAIKKAAAFEPVETYEGCGLYNNAAVRGNENAAIRLLEEIAMELDASASLVV